MPGAPLKRVGGYHSLMLIDLDPVDRITADAAGRPGGRTFYLQARKGDRLVTLLVEKQQVQLLAASVVEILARLGRETGEGPPEEEMGLEEPVTPAWRAGRFSISFHEERDLILLEAEEQLEEDDEDIDEEDEEEEDELPGVPVEFAPTDLLEEEEAEEGWQQDLEALDQLESLEDLERIPGAEGADEPERESARARFWATREQMLSLARHGASVCAQGRPLCPVCRNPIDPEGHQCPGLNGH